LRDFDEAVRHLNKVGFVPKTVIDIGVAWGTPALYETWPDAYFVLIEALPKFERHLRQMLTGMTGELHMVAVSDRPGTTTIHVDDNPDRSATASLLWPDGKGTPYDITIETIDRLLSDRSFEGPALMKTDIQGFDLKALNAAEATLERIDVVIAEASLFTPQNLVSPMIAFMESRGFHLYDICGPICRPYDNALGQVDLVFCSERSGLRDYDRWQ